jgi:hypothetical protein
MWDAAESVKSAVTDWTAGVHFPIGVVFSSCLDIHNHAYSPQNVSTGAAS